MMLMLLYLRCLQTSLQIVLLHILPTSTLDTECVTKSYKMKQSLKKDQSVISETFVHLQLNLDLTIYVVHPNTGFLFSLKIGETLED